MDEKQQETIRPLFTWRSAVSSPAGPPSHTTRHVLLAMGLYMNEKGESCFPSAAQLSDDTGLTERSVREHIRIAKESGWIEVSKHGFGGQKWARNDYKARIPADYHIQMAAYKEASENEMHYGFIPPTKKASKKEKELAVGYVSNHKATGKIVEKNCEVCGEENVQAHHHDYQEKGQVTWLCRPHHNLLHTMEKRGKFAFDTDQLKRPKVMNEVPEGHERGSKRSCTSFRKVMNEVHTNTSYNSSINTPENSRGRARVNGVPVPGELGKVDGFVEMYGKYCEYMKQQHHSWPNHFATETDFQLLLELKEKGNDPVKVIRQTIQGRNKSFFPLRDFKSGEDAPAQKRKSHQEFSPETYLSQNAS